MGELVCEDGVLAAYASLEGSQEVVSLEYFTLGCINHWAKAVQVIQFWGNLNSSVHFSLMSTNYFQGRTGESWVGLRPPEEKS